MEYYIDWRVTIMLTGIHFLLSYMCNYECDHCFVYSSPNATGTFTMDQIEAVLDEAKKIETMEWIFFEGGEPFMFYPMMVEGTRLAREMGFKVGIVTNSYWVTSERDAELWLKPLGELGISILSVSDDEFHFGDDENTPAKMVVAAADKLGIPVSTICIEKPLIGKGSGDKGEPVVDGGALLKGRAVEKLTEGLPLRNIKEFDECTSEELRKPKRVHVDSFGNVHMCQGVLMGNMWETPLSELDQNYDAEAHPICGPLLEGGPALLARKYDIQNEEGCATACHLCYEVRKALLDKYPNHLGPRQVYGLD
jgi:hypothetical protein